MYFFKNNKWQEGRLNFDFQGLTVPFEGIMPYRVILDKAIGEETVLFLKDNTDFIYQLSAVEPFKLNIKSGLFNSAYGLLLFMLFYIEDPNNDKEPFWSFDLHLNPFDKNHLKPIYEIAEQTHIHVFLLNSKNEQVNFFEFENTFEIDKILISAEEACIAAECIDFTLAKKEFSDTFTLKDLFNIK